MTKGAFLIKLKVYLETRGMDAGTVNYHRERYAAMIDEMIAKGVSEEAAVKEIGDPNVIAKSLYESYRGPMFAEKSADSTNIVPERVETPTRNESVYRKEEVVSRPAPSIEYEEPKPSRKEKKKEKPEKVKVHREGEEKKSLKERFTAKMKMALLLIIAAVVVVFVFWLIVRLIIRFIIIIIIVLVVAFILRQLTKKRK